MNALMSDLGSVHNKRRAGHLLQTIAAVYQLDISPQLTVTTVEIGSAWGSDQGQRSDTEIFAEARLI